LTRVDTSTVPLSGWARYPIIDCRQNVPRDDSEAATVYDGSKPLITRGNGRAYGDAALNASGVLATVRLNRMLAFHSEDGVLTCEAGVLLADIISVFLPRGWFPLVSPGTRFVTVGGLIAADVHGKNHHQVGSFCNHLLWLDLMLPTGDIIRCSPTLMPDLFAATCGGMGLTGTILRASFRLQPVQTGMIRQETKPAANLDEAFAIFEAELKQPYSVAWIDGLATGDAVGRSVVFVGSHAGREDWPSGRGDPLQVPPPNPKRIPFDFPALALSRTSMRLMNGVYRRAQRSGTNAIDVYRYFYPLDALLDWNRIYGRRGFMQYQCVLPLTESRDGIARLLREIARYGEASLLSVLKRMGPSSFGYLSFPFEGYTLAMDFPVTQANLDLLDRLDKIVLEHNGRLYLAKDSRAAPDTIAAGYPLLEQFREVRLRYGLKGQVESHLSRRLEL
jgi:decaprenylphospho-beta-D-ribofuranose 2-oxidase